jgi:hypothetical protein
MPAKQCRKNCRMRFAFSVLWLLLAISACQHHHVSPTKWVLKVARPKSCRLQLGAPKCNVVWAKHGFQKGKQLVVPHRLREEPLGLGKVWQPANLAHQEFGHFIACA